MNYARAELADRLASEYVLGTLQGGARRRFEALLPAHPMLRQAVTRWHDRLQPLARAIPPVAPAPAVWERIEARLDGAAIPLRAAAATPARAPSPARRRLLGRAGLLARLVARRHRRGRGTGGAADAARDRAAADRRGALGSRGREFLRRQRRLGRPQHGGAPGRQRQHAAGPRARAVGRAQPGRTALARPDLRRPAHRAAARRASWKTPRRSR